MLEHIGLDATADAVYGALLNGKPRTTDDLITATGLPRPHVAGALRVLQHLGLIRRGPGDPAPFAALDPGIVLDLLLLQREEQIKRARALVLAYSEAYRHSTTQRQAMHPYPRPNGHARATPRSHTQPTRSRRQTGPT